MLLKQSKQAELGFGFELQPFRQSLIVIPGQQLVICAQALLQSMLPPPPEPPPPPPLVPPPLVPPPPLAPQAPELHVAL